MRFPFARLRLPAGHTDRHLLDRYLSLRDEVAFAELVRRHGPLVWGVCRRTLAPTDAEDAFQATFLLLLRRRPAGESLAPWLYRAAVLTARTARRADRRRRGRVAVGLPAAEPAEPVRADLRDEVDAALMRLTERDRAAVVLCHLEGHTRAEAARLLGVPEGTLSARLSRALARLRLGRDPAAVLAVAGAGLMPAGLATATGRAADLYLAGGAVPPAVATITQGVLTMSTWKTAAAVGLVLVGLAGTGVGVGLRAGPPDKPAAAADQPADEIQALYRQWADLVRGLDGPNAGRAESQAELRRLETRLAELRARKAGRPDTGLLLADAGPAAGPTRYRLTEPAAGGPLTFYTPTLPGLAKLLTRTRIDRPELPLSLDLAVTVPDDAIDPLLRGVRAVGYSRVHYTGPALDHMRGLVAGTLTVSQWPRSDDPAARRVVADATGWVRQYDLLPDGSQRLNPLAPRDMFSGLFDLNNLK